MSFNEQIYIFKADVKRFFDTANAWWVTDDTSEMIYCALCILHCGLLWARCGPLWPRSRSFQNLLQYVIIHSPVCRSDSSSLITIVAQNCIVGNVKVDCGWSSKFRKVVLRQDRCETGYYFSNFIYIYKYQLRSGFKYDFFLFKFSNANRKFNCD